MSAGQVLSPRLQAAHKRIEDAIRNSGLSCEKQLEMMKAYADFFVTFREEVAAHRTIARETTARTQ